MYRSKKTYSGHELLITMDDEVRKALAKAKVGASTGDGVTAGDFTELAEKLMAIRHIVAIYTAGDKGGFGKGGDDGVEN